METISHSSSLVMSNIILPGDSIPVNDIPTTIGPGVYKDPKNQTIIPSSSGILHNKTNKKQTNQLVYIDSMSKRYIPKTNDYVIGIITGTIGESYKVSLQDFSNSVLLSMMAFPNASRKNRPNLKTGQVVYARVSQDIPEIDVELECIDPTTGKEGGFGLLDESGYVFDVNLNFANELLFNPDSIYLEKLSTKCKFEIAIGINGKVWIKCGEGLVKGENDELEESGVNDMKMTIAASKFLIGCQERRREEVEEYLKECFKGMK